MSLSPFFVPLFDGVVRMGLMGVCSEWCGWKDCHLAGLDWRAGIDFVKVYPNPNIWLQGLDLGSAIDFLSATTIPVMCETNAGVRWDFIVVGRRETLARVSLGQTTI